MRFSHTADCHLGGHRDPTLRELGARAFATFVDGSIAAKVDFAIIAGDLFNAAIPGIDALKAAVTHLSRLRDAGIPVYAIGGSHDASPGGKSMLDVLERAGLLSDVGQGEERDGRWAPRVVTDAKTGALLTGVPGRMGMLDHELYSGIAVPQRAIFLFHTAIAEIHDLPGALPASALPKGCVCYAGGHVHEPGVHDLPGIGKVGYPGPLFPNSFSELEQLGHGGYLLWEDGNATWRPVDLAPVVRVRIDATGETPATLGQLIRERLSGRLEGTIITLRIEGTLASGSPADIDLREAARLAAGARALLRNTARLTAPSLAPASTLRSEEPLDVEAEEIAAHRDQLALPGKDGASLARALLAALARESQDGEKQHEYRDSVVSAALRAFDDSRKDSTQERREV